MVRFKQENLILNATANKILNTLFDKSLTLIKKNAIANKQPNAIADKAVVLIRTK